MKSPQLVQHLVQLPGRRRSLLVGINYYGTSCQLSGCISDIKRVRAALKDKFGFLEDDSSQRVLLDEPGWPSHLRPTLSSMRAGITWLVEGAQSGDALYFHYSGHGGRRHDGEGGYNETLCPVDLETSGELLDTELFEILVKPLPSGCRLTCFMDCCHSAGVLDLPYLFSGTKENIDRSLTSEVQDMVVSKNWTRDLEAWQHGRSEDLLGDMASMGLGLWDLYRKRQASKEAGQSGFAGSEAFVNAGLAVGEVIAFTGCRSDQTSADVGNVNDQFKLGTTVHTADHAGGALTAVFLESLEQDNNSELTYLSLLERMRQRLESEGFEQVPQLASSLLVELKQHFSLTTAFIPPDPTKQTRDRGGFDGTDVAFLGGGAACAAGFLATLANSHHGESFIASSHSPTSWSLGEFGASRDMSIGGSFCERAESSSGQPLVHVESGALNGWGNADNSVDAHPALLLDTGALKEWGNADRSVDAEPPLLVDRGALNEWGKADQSGDAQKALLVDSGSLNEWGNADRFVDAHPANGGTVGGWLGGAGTSSSQTSGGELATAAVPQNFDDDYDEDRESEPEYEAEDEDGAYGFEDDNYEDDEL